MRHLKLLANVVEVARSGSIRKAAERLNLTPSAMNRRIQDLEAEVGTPLFERRPRGVRLTTAGEMFVRYARSQIAEAHVIGAIGDLRHRSTRAVALIEGDVEACLLEVAAILGEEKHSLRPLVFPVQDQLDPGVGLRGRDACGEDQRERKRLHSTKRMVSDHVGFPVRSGICLPDRLWPISWARAGLAGLLLAA